MNIIRKITLLAATGLIPYLAFAQHDHHHMMDDTTMQSMDTSGGMKGHEHMHMEMDNMSSAFSRNLPMNRNGSGTGWLPDNAPMNGYMIHSNKWMYMIHGNIFLNYDNQNFNHEGKRGGHKIDAPNWIMGMGQTAIGSRGLFHFSMMLSLDPLTVGGGGYPLLFQSGETWKGVPLVDHQHPHDLFSELSVSYSHMFTKDMDAFIYVGYPGEPALGPVAFMHRPSSLYNPDAPISHHWQDATHITFGVTTIGLRYKNFKVEGSNFTGREPDEDRYNFDKPRFDSWSARLSYNPSPSWALQVSKGWIKDVHSIGAREDVRRTTASAIHAVKLNPKTTVNSTAVWGYNRPSGHHRSSSSFLLESALQWNSTAFYGKYEYVQKSTEELVLDENIFDHNQLFPVNGITMGIQQKILQQWKTNFSAGAQITWYKTPDGLVNLYGKNPLALEIYLRIYPQRMMH